MDENKDKKNKQNKQNKQKDGLKVSFLKARQRGIGHAPCAKPFLDPAR